MFASTSAIMAILAATAAAAGSTTVYNMCDHEVYMCNTPSSGGGFEEVRKTLQPGDSYSQDWTILSTLQGWSLKLAPTQDELTNKPMQYEYTYTGSPTIWFDMSYVNGDPFEGNWVMNSSSPSCKPKHSSYFKWNDDAIGMQDCPSESVIELYVCGNSTSGATPPTYSSSSAVVASSAPASSAPASSAPASTSAPAYSAPVSSSSAVASSSVAPSSAAPVSSSAPAYSAPAYSHHHWNDNDKAQSSSAAAPSPTTFATQATQANGDVVTVIDVAYVTDYVTQTYWVRDAAPSAAPAKRHQHHPHAARHA